MNQSSYEYWQKRINTELKKVAQQNKDIGEEFELLHKKHLRNIDNEIKDFISNYAEKENITLREVRKRVSSFDVQSFSDKAKEYVANRDFTPEANAELRLYNLTMKTNRLELLRYNIDLEMVALANGEYKLTEKYLNQEFIKEMNLQAGIMGEFIPTPKMIGNMAQGIINTPYQGATWSERIWDRQNIIRKVLDNKLNEALILGVNARKFAKDFMTAATVEFATNKRVAERLAVTEMARVQTAVQKASYEANGFDTYVYIPEPTACEQCKKVATQQDDYLVKSMQPGLNAPPMHPWCRCSTAPSAKNLRKELEQKLKEFEDERNTPQPVTPATQDTSFRKDLKETILNSTSHQNLTKPQMKEFTQILDNMDDDRLEFYSKMTEMFERNEYRTGKSSGYYVPVEDKVYMDLIKSNLMEKHLGSEYKYGWHVKFHEEFHQLDRHLGDVFEAFTNPMTSTGGDMMDAMRIDLIHLINNASEQYGDGSKIRTLLDINKKSADVIIKKLQTEYTTSQSVSQISAVTDAIGLTTQNEIPLSKNGFWGHDAKYNKDRANVGANSEFFAEFGSAYMRNDTGMLEAIEKLYPRTSKLYTEVIEELIHSKTFDPMKGTR